MANTIENEAGACPLGAAEKAISTGNSEIDKKMGGGIPVSSLTLIEGNSDSGKSVLTQQMIWGSLKDNHRVTLFTTENTVKSLIKQMQSLNLDVLDYLLLGRLKVFRLHATRATDGLTEVLEAEKGQDLVIMDSLTTFISHVPTEQAISFFETCKSLCNTGRTIVATVHTYAFNESTLIRIGSMCDAHIRLRTEAVGSQLIKTMEVAKIRGAQRNTGNIISFDVEPGWGMRIIPFMRARA